jgi:hypothetical protein
VHTWVAKMTTTARQKQLSHFAGVVAGFRYLGELTQDEEQAWCRKMLVAVGYEPPEPAGAGVAQFMYLGDPKKRPTERAVPVTPPAFMASHSGPDREFEVHGGRFRVISVECYDTAVTVRWRLAPGPKISRGVSG